MCTCPIPILAEESALKIAGRLLLSQARCGINPGYDFLQQRVRRSERGLTHPNFTLPKLDVEGWRKHVPLSSLDNLAATILLAWTTWLQLTGDLSLDHLVHQCEHTEIEIALMVSCIERETLMAAQKDIFEILQFIQQNHAFSAYWPFKH